MQHDEYEVGTDPFFIDVLDKRDREIAELRKHLEKAQVHKAAFKTFLVWAAALLLSNYAVAAYILLKDEPKKDKTEWTKPILR